jgi:uncharacterized membrane protein
MTAPEKRIEEYLKQVRSHVRGLRQEQAAEIIAELRSHIAEKAASSGELTLEDVNAVLQALGAPEDLAREYARDDLLARVETSSSPLRLLDSFFAWATVSAAGFLVLIVTIAGYFLGVVFLLVALLKPFHPATAGLWILTDSAGDVEISVRMGFGTAPSNGHELLGWWIVPLGILLGCGLIVLMTRLALWCVSMYRRARPLRRRR